MPAINASTYNVGGQIDFETHRFYSSFSTDLFDSALFWHRADTLQIGFSPYRHDTNGLATWLIVSGRNYSGVYEKSELAFLVRLFRKRTWLEAGATTEGRSRPWPCSTSDTGIPMYKKLALSLIGLLAAGAVSAGTIEMKVNGLVCGFCAQGIEKMLRENPATDGVMVSLENKVVALTTKQGQDIAMPTSRRPSPTRATR